MESKNKTILDVLLERNRITETEAANFPNNFTNEQVEAKLRHDRLVSSEDIAKAYAILYDLPIIRLENYNIKPGVLNLIPIDTAKKYQIVVFDQEGNIPGGKIKIALGSPANLKDNPPQIVAELKEKKNVNVEIYITTPEDIAYVFNHQNQPLINPLPAQVPISTNQQTSNLKTVDLKLVKIPYEVISKFPIEISKKYNMVVFENPSPSMIRVAVSDPYNNKVREILDFVRQKNEITIEEFVASPGEISEAIKLYYHKPVESAAITTQQSIPIKDKLSKKTEQEKPKFVRRPVEEDNKPPATVVSLGQEQPVNNDSPENDLDRFLGQEIKDVNVLKQIAQAGNVPQILAATVALAAAKKASDIHIEPEETDLRIRFRIDGVLRDVIKMPLEMQPALISRIKILSRLKIDEQRVPQDGRFDVTTHGHEIDLRVSTLPTVRGEKAALRLLDKTQNIYSFEELGIAGKNLKILEENIVKPYGVILATGPTGSGKSTTLYSILQKISKPQVNVITLEDPVEYEIPGINQCQVKPKIGFSFAEGLRSVLRQDPNIIMVGEIRDAETAGMATHAALTGHLVLTTLHTNDAAGALPRLINMGIEPFLITSSVNVIIAQRLVRKICQKCKKEIQLPDALRSEIDRELSKFNLQKPYKFYEGAGCSECNQGYSGRIGIYEVLAMSEKIEELAIKRRPASEINNTAISEGMVTLKQDGLIKAIKGVTTVSEVLRVTTSG